MQEEALKLILKERQRQDAKFGIQDHDPFLWSAILTEEFGEYTKAALHNFFGGEQEDIQFTIKECTEVAAVGLAMLECLLRDDWDWPAPPKGPSQ